MKIHETLSWAGGDFAAKRFLTRLGGESVGYAASDWLWRESVDVCDVHYQILVEYTDPQIYNWMRKAVDTQSDLILVLEDEYTGIRWHYEYVNARLLEIRQGMYHTAEFCVPRPEGEPDPLTVRKL